MDDDYVIAAEKAVDGVSIAFVPGRFWIEFFPFLQEIPRWFPGAEFKRFAEEYRAHTINMVDKPFDEIKTAMVCTHLVTEGLSLSTYHNHVGERQCTVVSCANLGRICSCG